MRKLIILSTLLVTFLSCSVKEKPEFLFVENINVIETSRNTITVSADAYFKNPNDIGGELQTDEIKVFVNGNEMAQVSAERFEVPAKKEFSIPLKAKIPTDSLLSDKSLTALLGSLLSKKIKVQYKGDIKYKVFGFSHSYSIDKTEDLKIKF
ncbi:LEA type 2 family protein [Psychroserpens sp. XS_ASV72]|uniref:LEA type 2 family protein n=1 Tax=Psychroserpens sp. XS_ASV72 TaxID=3241293 RepID=UPI00351357A3